jgi:hypothetical protein
MQAPTHLAMGILIQKALRKVQPLTLQYFLIAFLAVMSHGILDKLTRFTYHPPTSLFDDWFWISYHLVLTPLTIFIFVKYWRKHNGIIGKPHTRNLFSFASGSLIREPENPSQSRNTFSILLTRKTSI